MKWGLRYERNSIRPYFLGHERDDVVVKRKELVSYLVRNKELYYSTSFDKLRGIKLKKFLFNFAKILKLFIGKMNLFGKFL
jgi:hypothetical protein